jgi:hypothetical protein
VIIRDRIEILLAISTTKSQQLSLGTWCVLGPSFVTKASCAS